MESVSMTCATATANEAPSGQGGRLDSIAFSVPGKPAPQGSKKHVGRGILVESSKELGPWRERVALAAREARAAHPIWAGEALTVRLGFVMPRPTSTAKRSTPPAVKRPDVDKLARAILDALTHVLFEDDSAVVDLHAEKRLAEPGEGPGVFIHVCRYGIDGYEQGFRDAMVEFSERMRRCGR